MAVDNPAQLIRIRDLRYSYPGGPEVLRIPAIDVSGRGLIAITGPSGAGKSTLIELLAGTLQEDYDGSVEVLGKEWKDLRRDADRQRQIRRVGFIPQDFGLLPDRTPRQMLEQDLSDGDVPPAEHDERVSRALEDVELADLADQRIGSLSGGQGQRVAVARMLARDVDLVIADEPTANLDPGLREVVMGLLRQLSHEVPVVVVTHDASVAEACDRTIILQAAVLNSEAPEVAATKRSHRVPIAAGVILVVLAVLAGFLLTRHNPKVRSTTPPLKGNASANDTNSSAPPPSSSQLAELVPTNYVVTKESTVHLDPTAPPLVVVTDTDTQSSPGGLMSSDLLLLAWNDYERRWVTVFNGAEAQGPNPSEGQPISDTAILPSAASVSGLRFRTITSSPGQTDLAFWAAESFGANVETAVGIVHYNGQTASLAYSNILLDGGTPLVAGALPHQTLDLTPDWITGSDPTADPIRNYRQVVSWVKSSNGDSGYYQVTTDTRSWLGAYAVAEPDASTSEADTPLVVVSVVPGSPAAGVLQPGDELLSVQGVTLPASKLLIGPAVVDQIAKEQPNTRIALSIIRGGQQLTEAVKLSSYAAAYATAMPPTPGYLGVAVDTDTSALAAEDGLGTAAGVVVTEIEAASPAESTTLTSDDVITSINGQPVTSIGDLEVEDDIAGAGNTVSITYVTPEGVTATTSVTLGGFPSGVANAPLVYSL